MQIQTTAMPGELRIMEGAAEIGFVKGSTIEFRGFATPTDAAWAAWEAYRGLDFRRSGTKLFHDEGTDFLSLELGIEQHVIVASRGRIARLIAPVDPSVPSDEWGFAMGLSADDEKDMRLNSPEVFLRTRARVMWRAIRGAGLDRKMHQYETHYGFTNRNGDTHVIDPNGFSGGADSAIAVGAPIEAAPNRTRAGIALADRHSGNGVVESASHHRQYEVVGR